MTKGQKLTLEDRACQGEAAAFGAVIRPLDRSLRGMVWSIVQTNDATDDVMQAAYEKAFRSIRNFNRRSTLKTWLHSICYRAAIDHVRYENRRRHDDIDSAERGFFAQLVSSGDGIDSIHAATDRLDLDARLATLDPEQRALLMLTVGMGYSFDETAVIVGLKRGTVASKVSRARARLAEEAQR